MDNNNEGLNVFKQADKGMDDELRGASLAGSLNHS